MSLRIFLLKVSGERSEAHDKRSEGSLKCMPLNENADMIRKPRMSADMFDCTTDWPKEEEVSAQTTGGTTHLWEESWDDDDTTDEFSVQLK